MIYFMYYVIQRHHGDPKKHYLAYMVPRYISSENSKNFIFEFNHDGVLKRKWAPKEEVVLLTENEALFKATLEQLESLKNAHLMKIDAAEMQLHQEIQSMLTAMQSQFELIKKNT